MRKFTSFSTAVAVAASAFLTPVANAKTPVLTDVAGSVTWPIKASFLRYVQGIAGGEIHTANGTKAITDAKGKVTNFEFPVNPQGTVVGQDRTVIDLEGSLHFYGHAGLGKGGTWGLNLRYDDLKILVTGSTQATLTADYIVEGGLPGARAERKIADDAALATFTLPRPITAAADDGYTAEVTPTLAAGGAASLLNYSEGTTLDDGRLNIALEFHPEGGAPTPAPHEEQKFKAQGSAAADAKTIGIAGALLAVLAVLGANYLISLGSLRAG
ncbi:HtaA domain-containing protein [Corynebacterium sp. TA-R-1]|uniref:HtaA domain-containing protein n=1 Tax=Corynebacterium stercoris TaxID=2943490 RepID=A0ABT1G3P3_9CORY|nr:HtaA domain-containing protein [Corynebacterium stercoris]MCP1387688.1 HtaA domain-containing protein [Corynebacterium stercoris]